MYKDESSGDKMHVQRANQMDQSYRGKVLYNANVDKLEL